MTDLERVNAHARAYPVSDTRDPRLSSATNGQGLPPGGRKQLKKLFQETRKIKHATLNVGSMTGISCEVVGPTYHGKEEPASDMCIRDEMESEYGKRDWCWVQAVPTTTRRMARRMEWELLYYAQDLKDRFLAVERQSGEDETRD